MMVNVDVVANDGVDMRFFESYSGSWIDFWDWSLVCLSHSLYIFANASRQTDEVLLQSSPD
jgi:hypothetical protein